MSQGATFKKRLTRRKFLANVGIIGLGFGSYAKFIEPTWLGVGRHEVKLSSRPDQQPLKLLHLSDLHASNVVGLDFIGKAIDLGLSLKPDVICVTGDFITRQFEDVDAYAKVLSRLPAAAPTFATLGNHDGGLWATSYGGYTTSEAV